MTTHRAEAAAQTTPFQGGLVRAVALTGAVLLCALTVSPRAARAAVEDPARLPLLQEGDPGQGARASVAPARPLTFEERVACRERVEDVYWAHRIWPKENPGPKPAREAVLSHAEIAAGVERSLRYETALAQVFGDALTSAAIQSELERQARSTRDPALLRELWAALDNDAARIAECLIRPELAERLIHERYAGDPRLHAQVRARAEQALVEARTISDLRGGTSVESDTLWIDPSSPAADLEPETESSSRRVSGDQWPQALKDLGAGSTPPRVGAIGPLREDALRFYVRSVTARQRGRWKVTTISWPKVRFERWWHGAASQQAPAHPSSASFRLAPLAATCTNDTWKKFGSDAAGNPGSFSFAFWTGSEVLVWKDQARVGAVYSPATNTWRPTSTVNAPAASGGSGSVAVWTGSELLVWGAQGGGRYSPAADRWMTMNTVAQPSSRSGETGIWTGTELIVWGGSDSNGWLNTGARYNPSSNTWRPTSNVNAPAPRDGHTAVWTGSQMIVWGGDVIHFQLPDSIGQTNAGAYYFPATDVWNSIPAPPIGTGPAARSRHHAFWVGNEMIVQGGMDEEWLGQWPSWVPLTDAWAYRPTQGTWRPVNTAGTPNDWRTAVVAGNRLFVWDSDHGALYDGGTDTWSATITTVNANPLLAWTGSDVYVLADADTSQRYSVASNTFTPIAAPAAAPLGRVDHSAVWTGTEMLLWGGTDNTGGALWDGYRYRPSTDTLLPMGGPGAPSGRSEHSAVWTGSEMIVWGGHVGSVEKNDGGRYSPATDTWRATSTATYPPDARHDHTAIWTGSEMIVWGGTNGSTFFKTGGRYDPIYDLWSGISAGSNCPVGRSGHTAVWTGNQMIVWGGRSTSVLNSGGRYDPATDLWSATSSTNAPSARNEHTAVWTGDEMIVWGGSNGTAASFSDGARYAPLTNTWTAIGDRANPMPRRSHVAVWTGREMIVWGGYSARNLINTGNRYTPSTNTWATTSTVNVPLPRAEATAIWSGSEMILWGGASDYGDLRSGARYCAGATKGLGAPTASDVP